MKLPKTIVIDEGELLFTDAIAQIYLDEEEEVPTLNIFTITQHKAHLLQQWDVVLPPLGGVRIIK